MSCEDYGLLYRLTEKSRVPQLRVNARAPTLGEVPVYNTFGTIKGTEKPNEIILLSAHFDSWDGSQGATDNGTGTIMMMEAMRILKQAYPHPKRTIMVGHWPGEEQGLNGSHAFAYDHPEIVRQIAGGLQSGQRHGTHSEHVGRRTARTAAQHMQDVARQAAAGIPGPAPLHRRWRAGHRRHRQRVVQLLRRAGVRAQRAQLGLRLVHPPHESRQLRQDRVRRSQGERDDRRDARVSRVGGSDVHHARARRSHGEPLAVAARWRRTRRADWPWCDQRRPARRRAVVARRRERSTRRAGRLTCPKTPRFTNDTSRVTAPSKLAHESDVTDKHDRSTLDAVARADRAREPDSLHRAGSRARRQRRRHPRLSDRCTLVDSRPRAVLDRGSALLRTSSPAPTIRPSPVSVLSSAATASHRRIPSSAPSGSSDRASTSPRICCAIATIARRSCSGTSAVRSGA